MLKICKTFSRSVAIPWVPTGFCRNEFAYHNAKKAVTIEAIRPVPINPILVENIQQTIDKNPTNIIYSQFNTFNLLTIYFGKD